MNEPPEVAPGGESSHKVKMRSQYCIAKCACVNPLLRKLTAALLRVPAGDCPSVLSGLISALKSCLLPFLCKSEVASPDVSMLLAVGFVELFVIP